MGMGKEVDRQKLAGLAAELGGIDVHHFRLGKEENYKYPLNPGKETYGIVDPETDEVVGVLSPWCAAAKMKQFRIYLLYPFRENEEIEPVR